ncbi:MAG: hypothetical protein JSU94_19735 [Phycisphaerales bacterium]|nr:MAG: hypothetical protein JSU94_19735 [Phycisphaerales bacterium]
METGVETTGVVKSKKALIYLAAVLLGGCLPSLHPLYTEDELIFEEKLVGKWSDGDDIWEFRAGEDKAYEMRIFDGKQGRFEAHLVQLDDMMFLDIFPDGETLEGLQDFYKAHLLGVHTFMKVEAIEPKLLLRMIDGGKVREMLESDPALLKHEVVGDDGDGLVLTASTEQLQQFMLKYGRSEELFEEATELSRREPLYKSESLIFEEGLVGLWQEEDGAILEAAKVNERTYRVIAVDEDGAEHRFLANLVKAGDARLLAIFFDDSGFDEQDPNSLGLVPDRFVLVGGLEPDLLLREIDYDEAAGMLGAGVSSPEACPGEADSEAGKFGVFRRI